MIGTENQPTNKTKTCYIERRKSTWMIDTENKHTKRTHAIQKEKIYRAWFHGQSIMLRVLSVIWFDLNWIEIWLNWMRDAMFLVKWMDDVSVALFFFF
jgi:hypothetical protein